MNEHPIKAWRTERNMTQLEAANAFNVSRWSVNQYEVGKRKPSLTVSKKIAKIMGVDRSELRPDVWGK